MTTLPKVLRDISFFAENTKSETNVFNENTKLNEPLFFPYGCEKLQPGRMSERKMIKLSSGRHLNAKWSDFRAQDNWAQKLYQIKCYLQWQISLILANQNIVYVTIILSPLTSRPCAPSALQGSSRESHGRDPWCAIIRVGSLPN